MPTLSSLLVQRGLASMRAVEEAISRQVLHGGDLATSVLELGSVPEIALTPLLAECSGIEPALGRLRPAAPEALRAIPSELALRHGVFPLELLRAAPGAGQDALVIATPEPLSSAVEDDLGFALGVALIQRAAPLVRVQQAHAEYYGTPVDRRFLRLAARLDGRADSSASSPPPAGDRATTPLPRIAAPPASSGLGVRVRIATPPPTTIPGWPPPSPPAAALEPPPLAEPLPAEAPPSAGPPPPEASPPAAPGPKRPPAGARALSGWLQRTLKERHEEQAPPQVEVPFELQAALAASLEGPGRGAPSGSAEVAEPAPRLDLAPAAPEDASRAQRPLPAPRPRRKGPFTIPMAEEELARAASTDAVLDVVFDFAQQYFEYAALFVVHGDVAEGRSAAGPGAGRDQVAALHVPLDRPGVLATARARGAPLISTVAAEGADAELLRDLGRPRTAAAVAVLPMALRGSVIALLYGDDGEDPVELASIGEVIALAALVAPALERVILLRKRGRSAQPDAGPPAPRAPRLSIPLPLPPSPATQRDGGRPRAEPPRAPEPAASPPAEPVEAPPPHIEAEHLPPAAREAHQAAIPTDDPPACDDAAAPAPYPPEPPEHDDAAAPGASRQHGLRLRAGAPDAGPLSARTRAALLELRGAFRAAASPPRADPVEAPPDLRVDELPSLDAAAAITEPSPPAPASPGERIDALARAFGLRGTGVEPEAGFVAPDAGDFPPATASPPAPDPGAHVRLTVPSSRRVSATAPTEQIRAVRLDPSPEPGAQPGSGLRGAAPAVTIPEARGSRPGAAAKPGLTPGAPGRAPRGGAPAAPTPAWSGDPALSPDVDDDDLYEDASDLVIDTVDLARRPAPPAARASAPGEPRARAASRRPGDPRGLAALVQLGLEGGEQAPRAAAELQRHGEPAMKAIAAFFPGPLRAGRRARELLAAPEPISAPRPTPDDAPARPLPPLPPASQCGPLLELIVALRRPALPFITVRSASPDPEVRFWATHVLGELPYPEAANALLPRLFDDDIAVRRVARRSAGALVHGARGDEPRSPRAPDPGAPILHGLEHIVRDPDEPVPRRLVAIETMSEIRAAAMVPALIAALSDSHEAIVDAAARALTAVARDDLGRDPRAWTAWWSRSSGRHRIEWLIDALTHEQLAIRRAAGDELKALTREYFGYYDDLPRRDRERAQARYREWWLTEGRAKFAPGRAGGQ
ncbi:MAG: hypothetical protein IT372_02910 [Polyangiaceae bacterium]|nr:hypothetical protein [Polyangiaceae bacterium]